jgi:hypothetical protein
MGVGVPVSGVPTREERHQARQLLVRVCVIDFDASLRDDRDFRRECAENGIVGFHNMSDADLIQATTDAGLDAVTRIQNAIAVLKS